MLPALVADFASDGFRKLVDTNIIGAFNVLHEAGRDVADNGSIIASDKASWEHGQIVQTNGGLV